MSVKIARLRNGEDVICDIYEVAEEESKEPVAYKLVNLIKFILHLIQSMLRLKVHLKVHRKLMMSSYI